MTMNGSNGWTEDRKLVEFRINQLERQMASGFERLSSEVQSLREESIRSRTTAAARRNLFLALAGLLGGSAGAAMAKLLWPLFGGGG